MLIGGVPLEELLFGFTFGMYWASAYEHLTWRTRATNEAKANIRSFDHVAWLAPVRMTTLYY